MSGTANWRTTSLSAVSEAQQARCAQEHGVGRFRYSTKTTWEVEADRQPLDLLGGRVHCIALIGPCDYTRICGDKETRPPMKHTILAFCVFLLLGGVLSAQTKNEPTASDLKACASLGGAGKGPWSVKSSEFVHPPFSTTARGDSQDKISVAVPFCRVIGAVRPTAESDI